MARSRQSLLLVLASILAVATGEDAAAAELAVDAAGPAPSLSRDRLVGFVNASELLRAFLEDGLDDAAPERARRRLHCSRRCVSRLPRLTSAPPQHGSTRWGDA